MEDFTPDFKGACKKADEILLCASSIKAFPFSICKVIEEFTDIELKPYSSLEGNGLLPSQITGSDDGALVTDGAGHFILFYNGKMPAPRLRFTAAHELGHYLLEHDMQLLESYRQSRDARFEKLYKKCEAETNMFAAEFYTSEPVLIELSKRGCTINADFLIKNFGLSKEAAEIRIKNIRKVYNWNQHRIYGTDSASLYDALLKKFKPFIDSIAPRKYSYLKEFEREEELERERQSWM